MLPHKVYSQWMALLLLWILSADMVIAQTTSTWNGTTGNWSDATRWSTDPLFPNNGNGGFDYNAVINGGTVTLDQDIEIEGFTLSGGTLTATSAFTLTINDLASWTFGTMSGNSQTTIASGATLSLTGDGSNRTLNRTLVNNGATTWTGNRDMTVGGLFQNNGSFTTVGNHSIVYGGAGGVFNNAGSFVKQTGFPMNVGVPFHNSGTVDVQGGGLSLLAGGTHTGDFTGAAGAGLFFSSDHSFAVGADLTGGMNVTYSGGTSTVNSLVNIAGSLSVNGGTQTFNVAVTASQLHVAGTANFNGPLSAPGGSLSGTLAGSTDWTVTGALNWTTGQMASGATTTIASGATLSLTGDGSNRTLNRTLVNNGATTWTGNRDMTVGGLFQNNGSFTTVGNHSIVYGGAGGVFNNAGSFVKQTGFPMNVGVPFHNSGTVDVQGGGLSLLAGGTHTGDFTGAAGAGLFFSSDHSFAVGADLTGGMNVTYSGGTSTVNSLVNIAGSLSVNGGTQTFNGAVTASQLHVAGTANFNGPLSAPGGSLSGTLAGSTDWTVTGALNWTTGQMASGATTTIASGATLSLTGDGSNRTLNRTLVNNGATTWTGNRDMTVGGLFQNNGSFTTVGNHSIVYGGAGGVFNNAGSFVKQTGFPMNVGVPFHNSGTVSIQQGTLTLSGGGTGNGQFTISPGATLRLIGGGFSYGGGFSLAGGTLNLTTYTLAAGTVEGTGTIAATTFTNASEVSPGLAVVDEIGAIVINGAYQQTTDGNLSLDIESASEFDTLDVNGAASLGGTLTVSIPNDGSVQAGDAFEVIAAGSTMGTKFDDVLTLGADDVFLAPVYTEIGVAVVAFDEGDMDRMDGVSNDDVAAFALALTDPTSYRGTFGVSAKEAGDIDDDGDIDVDDIDDFADLLHMSVAELTGRIADSANVPEPTSLTFAMLGTVLGMMWRQKRA